MVLYHRSTIWIKLTTYIFYVHHFKELYYMHNNFIFCNVLFNKNVNGSYIRIASDTLIVIVFLFSPT